MSEDETGGVHLPGLDGMNPLGFLAAVGLLRVLDHQARLANTPIPSMRWVEERTWIPVVRRVESIETIIGIVMQDKRSWADDPAFLLAYDHDGNLSDPRSADGEVIRDLKPPPATMRCFLENIAYLAERRSEPRQKIEVRRTFDTASAWGSELIQDNNGNTKPTAFHFTAGQQRFLDAAEKLREGIGEDDLHEALLGPWKRSSRLPSMSWDASAPRLYALRATDPSAEKRGSTPGADWLAVAGIGAFLSMPRLRVLRTTAVRGGWKDSVFTWPVWSVDATFRAIRPLLATRDLAETSMSERHVRGITAVITSDITRADQGGYGGFSPARLV